MTTTAAIAATTVAGAAVASADVVIPQTPTVQTSIAGDTFSATVTNTNTINSHCGLTVLTADLAPTTVFPAGFDIDTSNWDTHPDPVLPGTPRRTPSMTLPRARMSSTPDARRRRTKTPNG
ncbi:MULTISPECIES: hypothetical protein [Rhodococcus]|uniref:hypothetical protein n=1 Tax=Rhodococcus TaxID=1827 RepID=UPI00071C859C|nr:MULTISPECIES: hypothetical protein [Rhodococcus]ANQ75783.1 hypothetical protein AOT96_32910 [Rhodococcus sp. 008]KSU64848.1 hypothetical protein AS032_33215 [Rhodococcus qingshengii]